MSTLNVLLIGSPNSGKTTLFNRLTGLRAKTVNYPGSTVDLTVGRWANSQSGDVQLFDTPGVYSLNPRSPDEAITVRALETKAPHAVVAVVDATQLSRQLAIALQLREMFRSSDERDVTAVVVALTMLDLVQREGDSIDLAKLSVELGLKVIATDGEGAVEKLRSAIEQEKAVEPRVVQKPQKSSVEHLREAKRIKDLVTHSPKNDQRAQALRGPRAVTRKIDRSVLHPFFGPLLFFAVMTTLFTLIYWLAQPLMELVDSTFSALANGLMNQSWVDPDSLLARLVSDGLITGAGAVLIFVPQIYILFCGLVFLEDSGYLARAATIVDRPLKAIGLGGRSFVPLLSGFACAVPAMMAARTVNSRRERMLTLFVLPLMSCSARLPVYALLLGFVFGANALQAGFGLAALYVGSILAGVIAASLISRLAEKRGFFGAEKSFLMLELPLYRMPNLILVLKQALLRTNSYVKRTGPVILVLSVLIWAGTTFPNYREQDATVRLEQSFAGRAGQVLSPVFEPMGGDWRTGLGLISAFAAREVFVSTMAIIFHVTETDESEDSLQSGLLTQMREAKAPSGAPLFTLASTLGLMLFFMIALQCLATFAVALRESGSMKFAVTQLLLFNLVAYVLTVALVQGLRFMGIN